MPYSKDPHKYPPEMLQLLMALEAAPPERREVALQCEHKAEAAGKRVMVQSFFAAVGRHAEELGDKATLLRAKASSAAERRDRAARDTQEEYQQVKALAELWEARAFTARKWMVRVDQALPGIVIARRTLDGAFAASMGELLAEAAATPPKKAQLSEDYLTQQMALLRQASDALAEEEARQASLGGRRT